VDAAGNLLGYVGQKLGHWSNGKVSLYIGSFVAGATLLAAYFAWLFL
jgi:hypothetical protein